MGVPLYVIYCFSFVIFNILSLSFSQFDYYVSQCVPPCIYPDWNDLHFLDLVDCFLSHVREIFGYYFLKYFRKSFLSVFFFLDPYNVNIGAFNVVPEVSYMVFIFFHSCFYILFCCSDFHHSVLQVIYLLFYLSSSTIYSFQYIVIPIYSLVLLGLWQTFLAFSPFCSWDPGSSSSLYWTLFLGGCLDPLHLVVFGVLSSPSIWDITLRFLIMINFL